MTNTTCCWYDRDKKAGYVWCRVWYQNLWPIAILTLRFQTLVLSLPFYVIIFLARLCGINDIDTPHQGHVSLYHPSFTFPKLNFCFDPWQMQVQIWIAKDGFGVWLIQLWIDVVGYHIWEDMERYDVRDMRRFESQKKFELYLINHCMRLEATMHGLFPPVAFLFFF